jgi:Heparinase II C-terminal domain
MTGTSNTAVTWSVSGTWCSGVACGTIDSNGLYNTPSTVPSPALVTVSATSVADPTRAGAVDLTILPQATAGSTTTTITLNGQSYLLKAHPRTYFDGPGGVIDSGIKDPDGTGPRLALKATPGNPAWQGLLTRASFWYKTYPYKDFNNQQDYSTGQYAAGFAMAWYSDNSQTAYHDAALYMLNNIEKYLPSFCDENNNGCYFADATGYSIGSYGAVYWFQEWMFTYELMRGEMTSPQRQAFAAKWLNDIAAFGGVDGSPTTRCTNPTANSGVSVTVTAGIITASSPLFGPGNAIQVGDWIAADAGNTYPTPILSISDSTHATLPARSAPQGWNGYSGTISFRRATWKAGDCGLMWAAKHGRYAPKSITWVNGASGYPGWGGDSADTTNNTFAWYQGAQAVFLSLVDDDLNALTRAQVELTMLYNDFYNNMYLGNLTHAWTGFHLMGSVYGYERPLKVSMVNAQLQMSIQGTAPALGGIWDKNMLYHPVMNWIPSCATGEPQWGQGFGIIAFGGYNNVDQIANLMPLYFIYRNTNEGQWFNWTLKNRLSMCTGYGNTPGANLVYTNLGMAGGTVAGRAQWVYAYTDPAFPAIDMTGSGPTAAIFNHVDAPSGTNYPQSALISRTGYGSLTDTLLNFFGMGEWYQDHNLPSGGWYPGDYRIFKGNFLLAPDGGLNGTYSNVSNNYNNGGALSGYMEIGGAYNLLTAGSSPLNTKMPRGVSDSQNRFAYAMVDSSASYVAGAGVTRVHRHLVDFKSGQQFVVVYDDVTTSGGKLKRTYLHYPNNFGASADASRGVTTLSGTNVTSSYPGTGHSDATQLLTKVLSPAGGNAVYIYTDNADGTFSGGSGSTFRVSICASATGSSCDATNAAAEFAVVHEPIVGSGNTMAAATMLATIDVNHRGVQVDGGSSKVAIFPRNGQTYNGTTFTSTHSGMAQYVVVGLAAGTYTVIGPVMLTNQSVDANGVLYFEGAAGGYTVGRSGP